MSKTFNKKDLEANVLFLQGAILRRMNSKSQSYALINEAIDILKSDTDYNVQMRLSKILGYLSTSYMEDGLYDKAMMVLKHRKQIIDSLRETKVSPLMLDIQYGFYYAKMAYLSFIMDSRVVAEEFYESFMNTSFSKTPNGIIEINRYLLAVERFDEVISNNNKFFVYTEMEDTESLLYQRTLLQSAKAYEGMKEYYWAYFTMENTIV